MHDTVGAGGDGREGSKHHNSLGMVSYKPKVAHIHFPYSTTGSRVQDQGDWRIWAGANQDDLVAEAVLRDGWSLRISCRQCRSFNEVFSSLKCLRCLCRLSSRGDWRGKA